MPDFESELSLLNELPVEVLLDNILPYIPASDLLRLGCTNKSLSVLCNDDTLWKHKLADDFNFSGQGTARTSGWKFIYRGLSDPRVFVWGEKSNGRLGLQHIPKSIVSGGVPYPVQVPLQGARIVSLVAGGMSFHALDSVGTVHVWGTLNGTWMHAADAQGFSNVAKTARTPHKLEMPAPIRSISCGRLHSSAWDRSNKIWTFTNWGRPFFLSSPILGDPDYAPKQLECGWAYSALLTVSGDVFVWWPFGGVMGEVVEQKMREMDAEGDSKKAYAKNGVIPCSTWDLDITPTRLPSIPTLPDLLDTGNTKIFNFTELVQIAAFDNHLIGLTNRGHVLKYGSLRDEASVPHGQWEYLPQFSELDKVKQHTVFAGSTDSKPTSKPPQLMQISHITANFRNFVAYSTETSSVVLIGDTDTKPDSEPKIIPELQNKSVISVVIGDYHNAALTANGKLLTWGAYSNGALGLGDPTKLEPGTPGGFADERTKARALERNRGEPEAVEVPTEVRFDHNSKKTRERFCFATTAAGWHTGALVIDLEPGNDDDEIEEVSTEEPGAPKVPRVASRWETPPIIPLPGIFRMGHAARGGFHRGVEPPSRGRGNPSSGGNSSS